MKLSKLAQKLKPSATVTITAKAKALKAQGIDVIGFGAGEPDFDTPNNIKKSAISAINSGFTKYTAPGGIDKIKEAIIERIKKDYDIEYEKPEIIVSCGAKHILYNLTQVLIDDGDEVIIPAPYWVTYPEQVTIAGGAPVIINTNEKSGFKISPKDLEEKINERTKAIILNYPSNPTGSTYTKNELESIVNIALDSDLIIITDEIYDKIIYGNTKHTPIPSLSKKAKENSILVNGVSKAYSMTGWRIGYAAGNRDVIKAMNNLQGQCTSNPVTISQYAAIEAFKGSQDEVEKMRKEFEIRKDYIVNELNKIDGINCFEPQGAFYVFPNVSNFYGKKHEDKTITGSLDFTEFLLEVAKVAVVPGIEFGADSYIRISFAVSDKEIKEGISRISSSLLKLN